jgi:hypothetical protein
VRFEFPAGREACPVEWLLAMENPR